MTNYENRSKLGNRMLGQLIRQGYNFIEINDVDELKANFRKQNSLHNKVELKRWCEKLYGKLTYYKKDIK